MKFYAFLTLILAVCMLVMPALAFSGGAQQTISSTKAVSEAIRRTNDQSVTVYLCAEEKAEEIDLAEYLTGAVAAEMPATYHEQALQAQVIACHTYALYRRARESFSPTPDLMGADLSDNPELYQGYWDRKTRQKKWGDSFEENEEKIRLAVDAVQDLILTYDDEPIAAAFFAISGGRTESAANVFGTDMPYLQSVSSDADTLSPDCRKTILLTKEEFLNGLRKIDVMRDISELPDDCIGERTVRESGIVKSIDLCGTTVTGLQVREAFDLNSAAFTVEQTASGFTFHTMGHGHFVGMSQYGAEQFARSGADFRQILHHYYTDVRISDE